jgi:AAA family ATP:ADP antiporter
MLEKIRSEIKKFTRQEILFLAFAMLSGFLICTEYAIIRPVSNSLFIFSYTAGFFPYAWLAAIPLNFLIVLLYNKFLPKIGCFRMFFIIAALVGGGNLLFALFLTKFASLPFIFYIWKEVYIMLMFQQLWSLIHASMQMDRAKYLYGVIFGVGGLGGIVGSLISGFCAVKLGSQNLLFFSLPIYALLLFFFSQLLKNSPVSTEVKPFARGEFFDTLKNIGKSSFLFFILLIVIFMQMSSTIIDFQFNTLLEKTIVGTDLRTEYAGRVLGLINLCTIILQFVGSFLLLQFLGLRKSHFAIPSLLCLNAVSFLALPIFGVISFSYITIKAFDFSIFGVIKEMLYIPLKTDEKFRAKAFIDVFAYRGAKAFASFLILLLQFSQASNLMSYLTGGLILLFAFWAFIARKFLKKQLEQQLEI